MIYVATDRALRVQIEEVDGHERHCQGGMKRWGSRQHTVDVHSIAPPAGKVASASRSIIARFAREKRRAGFCSSRYWAATPSKWPGSYGLPENHESACATRAASSSSVTTSRAIWIDGATTPLVRRALSSAAGVVANVEQRLVALRSQARIAMSRAPEVKQPPLPQCVYRSWAVPRALQHKRVATWQGYARAAASGDNRNTQLAGMLVSAKRTPRLPLPTSPRFPRRRFPRSGQCNPLLQKLARNASLIP